MGERCVRRAVAGAVDGEQLVRAHQHSVQVGAGRLRQRAGNRRARQRDGQRGRTGQGAIIVRAADKIVGVGEARPQPAFSLLLDDGYRTRLLCSVELLADGARHAAAAGAGLALDLEGGAVVRQDDHAALPLGRFEDHRDHVVLRIAREARSRWVAGGTDAELDDVAWCRKGSIQRSPGATQGGGGTRDLVAARGGRPGVGQQREERQQAEPTKQPSGRAGAHGPKPTQHSPRVACRVHDLRFEPDWNCRANRPIWRFA